MSFASSDPQISSLDEKPLTGYRGISVAAVLTLALGIASSLALVHPFLWVVPLITIVTAVAALRAISIEGSNLTGRGLALAGMSLALLFGLWAPTRVISRQWQLYHQGQVFAEEWLDLVRAGKLQEAHQLALPRAERQPPGTKLETVYEQSEDLKKRFKNFFAEKPVKTMAARGDQATYAYAGGMGVSPREFLTEHIALGYTMRYEDNGQPRTQPLRIVLDRDESDTSRFYWRVREIADLNRADD